MASRSVGMTDIFKFSHLKTISRNQSESNSKITIFYSDWIWPANSMILDTLSWCAVVVKADLVVVLAADLYSPVAATVRKMTDR